jgi:hypothetical protein
VKQIGKSSWQADFKEANGNWMSNCRAYFRTIVEISKKNIRLGRDILDRDAAG